MRRPLKLLAAGVLVALVAVAAGCGDDDSSSDSPSTSSSPPTTTTTDTSAEPVVRDELARTAPANAPGQELYLSRVTIQPAGEIATHYHEGTQIARILEGTLTYTIVSGTVHVTRADGTVEEFTGPDEITLESGDALTETQDLIHAAANHGDVPVVISLASLLAEGAPPSTPVEE